MMAPWRQVVGSGEATTALSPLAATLAAALALVTGQNVLLLIVWAAFVLLDFLSAFLRVYISDVERWNTDAAIRGIAKKLALFLFIIAAGLIDMALGTLPAFGAALQELTPATKLALALLVGTEAGSALRNLRDATGNWEVYTALMRLVDRLRDPEGVHTKRWSDPDRPDPDKEGEAP